MEFYLVKESKKAVEALLLELKSLLNKEDIEETDLKKELIEEKHKLEKYESSVKENQIKCRHWRKEVS